MSQLALQHQAINLGQGFPDFDMSPELVDEVYAAMRNGQNQYAHMAGLPVLREKIAQKTLQLYGRTVNPETEVTITPGATYALYTALTTVLQPGDEVIFFEPAYDSYIPNITANGGIPIPVPLQFPDYSIDWQLVRDQVTDKTRVILINTPHNPTGTLLNEQDLLQLQELTRDTNILVISDEVYEHLVFDGLQHQSVSRFPELAARSFIVSSFGKTYHCTGWKMGYCIAPAYLMAEFRKMHQFNAFSVNTPMQAGIAAYLDNTAAYLQLGNLMQQKRDYFATLLQDTAFEPLPSHGSYFQCFRYRSISDLDDRSFATQLTREYGVASIPLSAFYQDGTDHHVIRFCFAKQEATLKAAAERLHRLERIA
jgi:methionine aminotransferase